LIDFAIKHDAKYDDDMKLLEGFTVAIDANLLLNKIL
jgi:hypothetical protein